TANGIPVPERSRTIATGPLSSGPFDLRAALPYPRDRARLAGDLQNVQPGIGAVGHVDIAAVVGLDIVALDRRGAAFLAVDLEAALFLPLRHPRDEVTHLLR